MSKLEALLVDLAQVGEPLDHTDRIRAPSHFFLPVRVLGSSSLGCTNNESHRLPPAPTERLCDLSLTEALLILAVPGSEDLFKTHR